MNEPYDTQAEPVNDVRSFKIKDVRLLRVYFETAYREQSTFLAYSSCNSTLISSDR